MSKRQRTKKSKKEIVITITFSNDDCKYDIKGKHSKTEAIGILEFVKQDLISETYANK